MGYLGNLLHVLEEVHWTHICFDYLKKTSYSSTDAVNCNTGHLKFLDES